MGAFLVLAGFGAAAVGSYLEFGELITLIWAGILVMMLGWGMLA